MPVRIARVATRTLELLRESHRHLREVPPPAPALREERGTAGVPEGDADRRGSGGTWDLDQVYREHAAAVSRWAARLAGPHAGDVEDMVHDVFLVVQRRLREFRGDARLTTWLYEITVRTVQARRRRQRRWSWLWPFRSPPAALGRPRRGAIADTGTGDASDAGSALDATASAADERASPLEALERRQATSLLYRFLDELDEKYRTAVVLFELEELSGQEIAAITGTSVSNVWARVSRGREKLLQAFADWEERTRP